MNSNRPLYDTGWRVGMPPFVNRNREIIRAVTTVITGIDGKLHEVTLTGYGVPEYITVDR